MGSIEYKGSKKKELNERYMPGIEKSSQGLVDLSRRDEIQHDHN